MKKKSLYVTEKDVPLPDNSKPASDLVEYLTGLKENDSFQVENYSKAVYACTKVRKLGGRAVCRPDPKVPGAKTRKDKHRVWITKEADPKKAEVKKAMDAVIEDSTKFPKMPAIWDQLRKDQGVTEATQQPAYRKAVRDTRLAIMNIFRHMTQAKKKK